MTDASIRIGVSLAEPPAGVDPIHHLRRQIDDAATDGFASAWMANIFGADALTALAVAGSTVPDIELGTAVIPTYPRHPAALAQQALTAQIALGGRLALGIGVSHRMVIEDMFGYSFAQPARHMREYLEVLLPLLRDGAATFAGQTVTADITLSTPRPHRTPVLLAALAPKMLRLAGTVADGTVLWMTGPETIASHILPKLKEAAEEVSRPAPRVVCILPVCVTDDVDGTRERANRLFSIYGRLPSYRAMLDLEGAVGPGDVAIVGDESTVTRQIRSLADFGVTDFVAASFGRDDDAVRTRCLLSFLASDKAA